MTLATGGDVESAEAGFEWSRGVINRRTGTCVQLCACVQNPTGTHIYIWQLSHVYGRSAAAVATQELRAALEEGRAHHARYPHEEGVPFKEGAPF